MNVRSLENPLSLISCNVVCGHLPTWVQNEKILGRSSVTLKKLMVIFSPLNLFFSKVGYGNWSSVLSVSALVSV